MDQSVLRRRLPLYAGIGAAALVVLAALLLVGGQALGAGPLAGPLATPTKAGPEIRVQIDGAVEKSGVYRLTTNERVEEPIKAAGGFARGADQSKVNLAQRLSDAQRVTIPLVPTPTVAPTGTATSTPTPAPATATPSAVRTASPIGATGTASASPQATTATAG